MSATLFEHFTPDARQALIFSQDEARSNGQAYIGAEHVLLGLIREAKGLGSQVLSAYGVTIEDTRRKVAEVAPQTDKGPRASGQLPFTPRAKRVVELSFREALSLDNNRIGTEHLLLGLIRDAKYTSEPDLVRRTPETIERSLGGFRSIVGEVLTSLGVDIDMAYRTAAGAAVGPHSVDELVQRFSQEST